MIKSPLNYIGGKYRLLSQIVPLFPSQVHTFVDLFAVGLDVSINVRAEHVICNDINYHVIGLYKYIRSSSINDLLTAIEAIINKYQLSKQNREGYNKLRSDYNETFDPLRLFMLVCYGFNHQIRFNNKGKFNNPFGMNRSSFNVSIERNLRLMHKVIAKFDLHSVNFRDFDLSFMKNQDFLYADPPYLISCGTYNDGKRGFEGWCSEDDAILFEKLDYLNDRGVKFALSNMVYHKGIVNEPLMQWSEKYHVHQLNVNYSNSNYHAKIGATKEVLITNYR